MGNEKTLGQIAFEAYGENRKWQDWRGNPMPLWSEVQPGIRGAWETAAEAVEKQVTETLSNKSA